MVQVLPAVPRREKKSFIEKLGPSLPMLLQGGMQFAGKIHEEKKQRQQEQEENDAAKKLGVDLTDIHDPNTRRQLMVESLKGKQQENDKKSMFSFGEKLKNANPNNPMYQTLGDIYQSGLPANETSQIVRALNGVDPFRVQQQNRLQLDSVLKRYSARIKELDDELKDLKFPNTENREEAAELKRQRSALRSERDQLLDFKALNFEDEGEQDFEDERAQKDEKGELTHKVKFNPKNKDHISKFNQLDKKFKGNREKVNAALAREFS